MAEIQNPNQQGGGGGQDSRTLFGFMMVFVLMVVAFQVFGPKKAQQQPEHPQQKTQAAASAATPSPAVADTPTPEARHHRAGHAAAPAAAPAANTVQATSESDTVVENELYRITFSNRGGVVKSWVLKKYKDDDQKSPLDLVNHEGAAKLGLPLSLYAYDAGVREKLNSALYVPSATGTITAPGSLSFDYSAGGLTVHKTFRFDSSYVIHADVSVTQNGAPVTALLAWPSGLGDQSTLQEYAGAMFDQMESGKTDEIAAKKVVGGETLHGAFDYAGISDLYFAAVFLPDDPANTSVVTLHDTVTAPRSREHSDAKTGGPAPLLGAALRHW